MVKIAKNLTSVNFTPMTNKQNKYIVIHYVGAVSTALNNTAYFKNTYRGASAHYFVDENSIFQCVEDTNKAWHVGAKVYYNGARNENSIGIEMCCKKKNGRWYFEPETERNTMALTKQLMDQWNIPITNVCRHYDVTRKICGEPYVSNYEAWQNFLKGVQEMEQVTREQKEEIIKQFYGFDNNTIKFFEFYRYNDALIDKLYQIAKNGQK